MIFSVSIVFVKYFLYLLGLCLHSFSKILDYLYYHYSEFFFQGDCLSLFHLVVLLGFYLVPSSGIYFSAVSFCLTFCVCGLRSAGCQIVVLASGVCLNPWLRLVQGLVQASWWDGLVPAHGRVELGLVPLVGRAVSRGVSRGGCGLRMTLGSCQWVGLYSHLVGCLVRGVQALEPAGCWVGPGLSTNMATSGRRDTHAEKYSLGPPLPVSLPLQWATANPCLPRRPSKTHR